MLTAISPIDGRYQNKTQDLSNYFSEMGLIKYRLRVEIEYLIALSDLGLPELPAFSEQEREGLRSIYHKFTEQEAQKIKDIESVTNHDVKAV
jgi:adenylosuccinate lyase